MKRKFSLIVLAVMLAVACIGVLAACNKGLDEFSLTTFKREVEKQFSKAAGTSYTLDSVVKFTDESYKEVTCAVEWTTDNDNISIAKGTQTVTITVPSGITSYILTGTLIDGNGKAYQLDGKDCAVQKAVTVSTSGGNQGGNTGGNTGGNQGGTTSPSETQTVTFIFKEGSATVADWTKSVNNDFHPYTTVESAPITLTVSATKADKAEEISSATWWGANWRLYKSEKAALTISAASGYHIVSVTITGSAKEQGSNAEFSANGATVVSGDTLTVNGSSITLTVTSTQARISEISVVCAAGEGSGNGGSISGGNTGSGSTGGNTGGNTGETTTTPDGTSVTFDMTGKTASGSYVNFTTITEGDITITATDGTGGNTETRYSAFNLRVYYGGSLTIAVASGKTIKSITFTVETHDKAIDFTASVGTYASQVWTGESASVTFSSNGTKGHVRITGITVIYA